MCEWCFPLGRGPPAVVTQEAPCFLILMTINRFCSVSALLLQGRDRKREKKEQGSQNKQAKEIVRERERGPLIENSWQLIRGKGDPVCCTDRVGMCGQMMMTGSMTTLPLSVPAKTHLHWLTACMLANLLVFQKKILDLVCSFMTMPLPFFLNVISWSHNYVTAIVQCSPSKITVFTWQHCLYVPLHNIVVHQIFIHASCLIVWSVCTTHCRAKLAFPWKHTISCELLVCCNITKWTWEEMESSSDSEERGQAVRENISALQLSSQLFNLW